MLELLFPTQCTGCGRTGDGRLCDDCRQVDLFRLHRSLEGIEAAWTLSAYDSPLGQAIVKAKTRGDRALAKTLSDLLAARAGARAGQAVLSAIVPAPSNWIARMRRGFAMSALLAAALSRTLSPPVVHGLRVHLGPQQAGLSRQHRVRNLAGRLRASRTLTGHVLLVDDVLTTGATAEACARELLGAGATHVSLIVLCAAER